MEKGRISKKKEQKEFLLLDDDAFELIKSSIVEEEILNIKTSFKDENFDYSKTKFSMISRSENVAWYSDGKISIPVFTSGQDKLDPDLIAQLCEMGLKKEGLSIIPIACTYCMLIQGYSKTEAFGDEKEFFSIYQTIFHSINIDPIDTVADLFKLMCSHAKADTFKIEDEYFTIEGLFLGLCYIVNLAWEYALTFTEGDISTASQYLDDIFTTLFNLKAPRIIYTIVSKMFYKMMVHKVISLPQSEVPVVRKIDIKGIFGDGEIYTVKPFNPKDVLKRSVDATNQKNDGLQTALIKRGNVNKNKNHNDNGNNYRGKKKGNWNRETQIDNDDDDNRNINHRGSDNNQNNDRNYRDNNSRNNNNNSNNRSNFNPNNSRNKDWNGDSNRRNNNHITDNGEERFDYNDQDYF